jgi:hypothetical protein
MQKCSKIRISITGSVTLWNDDPMSTDAGLFHYPASVVNGWSNLAHTHFSRPWHVWNYGYWEKIIEKYILIQISDI